MAIRRKLSHVQLKQAYFVPGFGELKGRTLNTKFYPNMTMIVSENAQGIDFTINETEFFIPFSGVDVAVYVSAAQKPKEEAHVKAA